MSTVDVEPGKEKLAILTPRQRRTPRVGRPFATPRAVEGAGRQLVTIREGWFRRCLALADAVAAAAALLIVVAWLGGAGVQAWILAAMPVAVLVSKVGGLYERDELVLRKTTLDECPALLQISGLFALITYLGQNGLVGVHMTPTLVLELWIVLFAALFLARVAARRVATLAAGSERCMVLGDAEAIATITNKLRTGSVNAEAVATLRLDLVSARGMAEQFRELVTRHDVHRIIVAPVTTDARDTIDVIRIAKRLGVRVSVVPRLFEAVGSSVEFDHLDGLTMLGVRRFGLTRSSHALKRAFDLVGATVMLVSVAPIMAVVGLAIRIDSKGPILFRQTRVGRDGVPFEILKFRTMVPEADDLKHDLLHLNEAEGVFKIAKDPRITRVGAFLRRTALDELPQLLNVWRGEMSLVGPRPLVLDEDAKIEGLDRSRLHLTPGMTGGWQILGSARVPLQEMVGIDYLYVANWSLWTDLKILLRTVPYVLGRRGM